jgi:hypothetical protein
MDMMVLCRCHHPSALHTENGCRAGRYQVCSCTLDAHGALKAAIEMARTPSWNSKADSKARQ